MTSGTEAAQDPSVPEETPALLTPPEAAPTSPAEIDVLAYVRTEARSWSPATRRAYVAGWNSFTGWSLENRSVGLPAAPAYVGRTWTTWWGGKAVR